MRISNRLVRIMAAAAVLAGTPAVLDARTRQGDKFLAEGLAAERLNDWDKALELFTRALEQDPSDVNYRIAFFRARFQAAQARVNQGQKLRAEGKLEEAAAEFEKARSIDPASNVAEQELQRTRSLIERAGKPGKTIAEQWEDKGLSPVEAARKEIEERRGSVLGSPALRPLSSAPITLKINNQPPKVVFETIGKLAGVNVLFDPDYATQNQVRSASVDLVNATLEQALDYAAVLTRSFWKPLSANAVFITMDVANKRADYEDQTAKVFYLTNVTTPQELQEVISAVRLITNIQRIMPFTSQNAFVARGTPDQIALAELLVHDLDRPRAEVVVDVVVMEVSRTRSRDLAATLVSGGASGINVPIGFTPRNPVTAGGGTGTGTGSTAAASSLISLARIGRLSSNDFSVTLPGAVLEALMSDSGTRVLQSPQLRTVDSQKASLKIGERVPYSTGGFQPLFGQVGGGGSQLYSQFQFLDVGVNVDITPKIHSTNEVSLHIELDISNVRGRVDFGGISQPIVGQRKVVHDIRLREGETSLLGGLLQTQETRSVSGVPGLASIPILGRLFSSETVEKNDNELMIAIIPHVVRTQDLSQVNFREIAVGAVNKERLTYSARQAREAVPPEAPKPAAPQPEAPAPPAPQPEAPPAAVPEPGPPPPPAAPPRVVFAPAAIEAEAGASITVNLQAENVADLFAAPLRIKFDPNILRLDEVARGDLLALDGKNVIFTRNILNDTGDATVNLTRLPGTGGVSGSGMLVTLTFYALKPGTGAIAVEQLNLQNESKETVLSASPRATVSVR